MTRRRHPYPAAIRLWASVWLCCALFPLGSPNPTAAQQPNPATPSATATPATGSAAPAPADEGMVSLDFPETIELRVLIDYVGKRVGINFLYDEGVGVKRVTLKSTRPIPSDSLMPLLQNVLAMNGMAMTPTSVPGTLRIQIVTQLAPMTGPVDIGEGTRPAAGDKTAGGMVSTRVFELRNTTAKRIEAVITPFFSSASASMIPLPEHGSVIVTDLAANMARLESLIAFLDRPKREVATRFIQATNVEAAGLAQRLTQLLLGQAKARGEDASAVTVLADERTNRVVIVGIPEAVEEAARLTASLDAPPGTDTRLYKLAVVTPEHLDRLVRGLIGELSVKQLYKSVPDAQSATLVVSTTPAIHQQIEAVRAALDVASQEDQSPIRFYKLENAKAYDVLGTIELIEGESGLGRVSVDGVSADPARPAPPSPVGDGESSKPVISGPQEGDLNPGDSSAESRSAVRGGDPSKRRSGAIELRGGARIMADDATNSIIIVGPAPVHAVYERLIKRLDVRRPQVLVEATVVSIDSNDDFSLGVEISRSDDADGGGRVLNFSNFGLSTRDPVGTGDLTLRPGVGFTGAVISSDIAEVVIRALKTDKRTKVVSQPSVLINDNATGSLKSEAEEPFASVNASNTVSTTSFGGFVKAGAVIDVTPQISEGDFLKLEYQITLSSFGEPVSDELPPTRQTNTLRSEATIPNGYTIVVGGLTRETISRTIDSVPLLGRIPLVKYAFSSRSNRKSRATLFVFIRAVILRDDQFRDLKTVSSGYAGRAELPGDYPESQPVEMR